MPPYKIISETSDATVVTEYKPVTIRSAEFQSEAQLEKQFIRMLEEQSYEYLPIHNEEDLKTNLRRRLEILNDYHFSEQEWHRFFNEEICDPNWRIDDKTRIIQEDYRRALRKDDGLTKNIQLIEKDNVQKNYLQVINQYEENQGRHKTRYDVTILVNGLPLVHVELKRRGIALKQAFNQINRYQRDSFWAGSGLFEYIQIFVISNGTHTKYYSNTTRWNHLHDELNPNKLTKTSNSFEFTSFWADAANKPIPDLVDFTRTFFARHTLLNILTRYCVYTTEKLLLVMRPYQIVATEKILSRIITAGNYRRYGGIDGGGYIWHTTGSGKTLTSFKTARLATEIEGIDKVLFVVDRKDLDYQTMREYDHFEKGAANSNTSTAILKRQLEDERQDRKIIITTIQKLTHFIKQNNTHPIYSKRIVIIFDECHRSQFGEMHDQIVRHFRRYNIFGFTGTPIFRINAPRITRSRLPTTEQVFGERLHTYTIIDAIRDQNVLPFRIDYISTIKGKDDIIDKPVKDIDREDAYNDPQRIAGVTHYILEHFDQKTYRHDRQYTRQIVTNIDEVIRHDSPVRIEEKREARCLSGFNSILATASIEAAKRYYLEFKRQMSGLNETQRLKIAIIYSYQPNAEETDEFLGEESVEDTANLSQSDRDFLDEAIKDYNEMFGVSFDTSSDKFQNYYKDVSMRMKNKELDLLIVVDMFLTGFDATTLNTLWVDKNLRMHGLIQAYSRTNRILNSIKNFGNIICFRNLQTRTNEAISLFGDEKAAGIVLLKGFRDYYDGYETDDGRHAPGYRELIEDLRTLFPLSEDIEGEKNEKAFLRLFGQILHVRNILSCFDEFTGRTLLSELDFQDYQSLYLDTWEKLRHREPAEKITDDLIFETELLRSVEVNIDYILVLVKEYHDNHCQDETVKLRIMKAIASSGQLRSKKALILSFLQKGFNDTEDIYEAFKTHINTEKEKELMAIITSEELKEDKTRQYMQRCFETGELKTFGTDINEIMPAMSRFAKNNARRVRMQRIIDRLRAFFERYSGL